MSRNSRYPLHIPSVLYEQVKQKAKELGISANELMIRAITKEFQQTQDYETRLLVLERAVAKIQSKE